MTMILVMNAWRKGVDVREALNSIFSAFFYLSATINTLHNWFLIKFYLHLL